MNKIYQSLELLNYKLKRCFNPPAIKIIENEKYVSNNNEFKSWEIPNNENFVASKNSIKRDAHGLLNCKSVRSRSCETLYYPSKNIPESENILRNWKKNNEDGLVHKNSEMTLDFPIRSATRNEKSRRDMHESGKNRLVQYDSHTSLDYRSTNARRNEKFLECRHKCFKHGLVQNRCKASFDYSSSDTYHLHRSSKDELTENCSETSLDYLSKNTRENKQLFENLKKISKSQLIQNDSNANFDHYSRNVAKSKISLRNQVENIEDAKIYENSEINLGYSPACVHRSKKSFKNLSKMCTELNEDDLFRKSSIFSLWNVSSRSVKHLQDKTKSKRINYSLKEKIKIVENPKYLPEYTAAGKELEEEILFSNHLKPLVDSPDKMQKDPDIHQDNTSKRIWTDKSFCDDKEATEDLHSDLDNFSWINNDLDMQDLATESKGAQNIRGEGTEDPIKNKMHKSLNPFDSDEYFLF